MHLPCQGTSTDFDIMRVVLMKELSYGKDGMVYRNPENEEKRC